MKDMNIGKRDIVVRATRHHDDHKPLKAGELDEYLLFKQTDLEDETMVSQPWTDKQLRFVESDAPVRLIQGRPGSGKTTTLWRAIEARDDQKILYLTWSRELTALAEERLRCFAPKDVRVITRDFVTFLGDLSGRDIDRQTLSDALEAFLQAVKPLGHLGLWEKNRDALFAEVRAHLIGRAVPEEDGSAPLGGIFRLRDEVYREERGIPKGVGSEAAKKLLRTVSAIHDHQPLEELFPELAAAAAAICSLRENKIPKDYEDFDRIVVDEAQDLTVVESRVVVELCRALGFRNGHAPWLLIAADEGQTVRPSGFEWGQLKGQLSEWVATPSEYPLDDNLRCPERIDAVLERVSERYKQLEKVRRPTKQQGRSSEYDCEATVVHVNAADKADAVCALESLEPRADVQVLTPDDRRPDWVPESLSDSILTPAQAKGLEYQHVVVVDPGRLLTSLDSQIADLVDSDFSSHITRTGIDQLRVALSRATETLVFLDVSASAKDLEASREALGTFVPYTPEELVNHFESSDAAPEERVLSAAEDARALIDEVPARAWRRARQAVELLGNPELPNGVSTPEIRTLALDTLVATAARLLVDDSLPDGLTRANVLQLVKGAVDGTGMEVRLDALTKLNTWSENRTDQKNTLDLLETAAALEEQHVAWLAAALPPFRQTLKGTIESAAANRENSHNFAQDVEAWLRIAGFAESASAESMELRRKAVSTLIDAGESRDLKAAGRVLKHISPTDHHLIGRLLEARGRFEEAAQKFLETKALGDATRAWRRCGRWEEAFKHADGEDKTDLEWLLKLDKLAASQPKGLGNRLYEAERTRIAKGLKLPGRDAATTPDKQVKPRRKDR